MRINSIGNVGIGTSSPSELLTVDGFKAFIALQDGRSDRYVGVGHIAGTNSNNAHLGFYTVNNTNTPTEKMRVDANGLVGIGLTNPTAKLDVSGTIKSTGSITCGDGGSNGFNITRSGQSLPALTYNADNLGSLSLINPVGNPLRLGTSSFEWARFDPSGSFLLGKTVVDNDTQGIRILGSVGFTSMSRNGGEPLILNRNTDDGQLLGFRKDGTNVGSIGSANGAIVVGSGTNGLRFDLGNIIEPFSTFGGGQNGVIDLGFSGGRFRNIFLTNSPNVSSDSKFKTDIEEIETAEINVAKKAKTLLRKYRLKASIEEKGNDARIHFGIIAQDLEQAFIDEGLDARRYSMFCADMNEETGEEDLSIRYEELLAFIILAI